MHYLGHPVYVCPVDVATENIAVNKKDLVLKELLFQVEREKKNRKTKQNIIKSQGMINAMKKTLRKSKGIEN